MSGPVNRVELVVFDLGRVLMRICDNWHHACEVAGIGQPPAVDAAREAKLLDLVHRVEVGSITHQEFCDGAAPLLGMPSEHVDAISNAYPRGAFPGAGELLADLKKAGFKVACLSNTNANHWRILCDPDGIHAPGMTPLDFRFASHLMKLRKPDPAIYALLEAETQTTPQQIIFFDDLAENVAAARARGWNAFQIEVEPDPIVQIRRHLREFGIALD